MLVIPDTSNGGVVYPHPLPVNESSCGEPTQSKSVSYTGNLISCRPNYRAIQLRTHS